MKQKRDTGFTVELLGLFILLIVVITVISSVFVMSRARSLQAKQLTEAVILAESTAETASAYPDNDSLMQAIANMDNSYGHEAVSNESSGSDGIIIYAAASIDRYDPSDRSERFLIRLTRTYPDGNDDTRPAKGIYASDVIDIFEPGIVDPENLGRIDGSKLGEPIYTLSSGEYFDADSLSREEAE